MTDLADRLRGTAHYVSPDFCDWGAVQADFREAADALDAAEVERYLGVACPICGRMRLLYDPTTHAIRCEKCEATTDIIYDANPAQARDAAEARIRALEEGLRWALREAGSTRNDFTPEQSAAWLREWDKARALLTSEPPAPTPTYKVLEDLRAREAGHTCTFGCDSRHAVDCNCQGRCDFHRRTTARPPHSYRLVDDEEAP